MRKFAVSALFWACVVSYLPVVHADSYRLVNMGPAFKEYVNAYRNASPEDQWKGWKEFEAKFQIYFDTAFCAPTAPGCEENKKMYLQGYLQNLPPFEAAMWEIFDHAELITSEQIKRFREAFPDLQQDIPVIFMPSYAGFLGMVKPMAGIQAYFVGADLIAKIGANMNTVFSHELFHVYHEGRLAGQPVNKSFASPLWIEGFATFMSVQLSPGATDSDALFVPELGEYCAKPVNVAGLAKAYLQIIDLPMNQLKTEPARSIYSDWFVQGPTQPQQRGYCLGLHALRKAADEKLISTLVNLNEEQFGPYLRGILTGLSQE